MLSDGESWSGEVEIARTREAKVPVFVVGVGTFAGGDAGSEKRGEEADPGHARARSRGLQKIAAAGGGQYFELDREPIATSPTRYRRGAPAGAGDDREGHRRRIVLAVSRGRIWRSPRLGGVFVRDLTELWIELVAPQLRPAWRCGASSRADTSSYGTLFAWSWLALALRRRSICGTPPCGCAGSLFGVRTPPPRTT